VAAVVPAVDLLLQFQLAALLMAAAVDLRRHPLAPVAAAAVVVVPLVVAHQVSLWLLPWPDPLEAVVAAASKETLMTVKVVHRWLQLKT
jgi:hypothetical protein